MRRAMSRAQRGQRTRIDHPSALTVGLRQASGPSQSGMEQWGQSAMLIQPMPSIHMSSGVMPFIIPIPGMPVKKR